MVSKSPTITDAELIRLSCQNPELRFERNADGTLVTMAPIGSISANRELKAGARLLYWVEQNGLGEVFSSSGGFKLANSAVRSPDVAFVTDSLSKLKRKMEEYRENGVKLGWLIDRHNKQAFVYRQDGTITCYPANAILSGEDVVPGFTLALEILL